MNELFEKKSLPFYKFGDAIYLQKIGISDWIDYICGRFEATGKHISKKLANVSIVKRALVKKELIEIKKRQAVIPAPVMTV